MAISKTLATKFFQKTFIRPTLTARFFSASGDGSSTSPPFIPLADEASKQAEQVTVAATNMSEMSKMIFRGDLPGPSEFLNKIVSLQTQGQEVQQMVADPAAVSAAFDQTLHHISVLIAADPRIAAQILVMGLILDKTSQVLMDRILQATNLEAIVSSALGMMMSSSKGTKHGIQGEGKQKKLDAIQEMTDEAFVIFVPALGFQKRSIHLSVKGRVLSISGWAVTPQGPRVLKGDVEVPEAIFFDTKQVVAAMQDGYLQVRFPFGSKETMIEEESFLVGWGNESAEEEKLKKALENMLSNIKRNTKLPPDDKKKLEDAVVELLKTFG